MKKLICIASLLLCSLNIFAHSNPEELIEKFFKDYSRNPAKAVENIYATNPWVSRVRDGVESVKNEVNKYTEDYVGKYYGYEFICSKQLAGCFTLYSYLVKYERQPMRYIFKFYKPDEKWLLYSFKIDSELDEEMEKAASLYNLNLEKVK